MLGRGGGEVGPLSYFVLSLSESPPSDSSQEAMGGEAEGQLRTLTHVRPVF